MKLSAKWKQRIDKLGIKGAIKLALAKSVTGSRRRKILSLGEPEERFTAIYKTNHWNDLESRSGEGSTVENTQSIRLALPDLFEKYKVRSILDAPCGDFNWMQDAIEETRIKYIGGDIVKPMIERNQTLFGDNMRSFIHLDLTKTPLPDVDLLFCRDCLFHLCYHDIARFFENFLNSSIPYLMTTSHTSTHDSPINNHDIATGDMRPIDLFSPPFSLNKQHVFECVTDFMVTRGTKRFMILVNRKGVEDLFTTMTSKIRLTD